MNGKFAVTVKGLVAIGCFSSGIAIAQNKVEDYFAMSPAELAETPVTIATGTPKPVFQAAAVTSVVTAEQIKSMGATELHEVLETVPGVHATLQPNVQDYSYSMRGIHNAQNSQVLILLNGTRITTPFNGTLMSSTELPIEAIQQVEVIRGPGSALYGADAFAGVINIITKKAKDINGKVLGVRAGDHGTQSGWGQYGDQWAGWDVATSFQYQHTDGDGGRIVNADAQTAFDGVFGTHVSQAPSAMDTRYETLNGHLNLQRKHWDIGFWAFNSINTGSRAGGAGAVNLDANGNGQQYLGDVRFSTEDWFEKWELTARASYLQAEFQGQGQLFPNNAVIPIGSNGNLNFRPPSGNNPVTPVLFSNGVNADVGRTERIPSMELSSIYKGLDNHILRFITGFRYEGITASELKNYGPGVINGTQSVVGGALTDVTGTPFVYLPNVHRTVASWVLQDEWQVARDWQFTVGVRYDHYSDFGGTFNPRLALVWDINEQLTSKLLYGKAFRAPNFAEQFTQNNPVFLGTKSLQPETINTYEWAFSYRPISSLSTAINVFYYQIEKLISAVPDPSTGINSYKNSGNQNGYGTELEENWQLTEKWNIKGNYAWQHSINEATQSDVTGVPEHHVYVALGWQFLPRWNLQPQFNWIGGRIPVLKDNITSGDNWKLRNYETIDLTLRGKKLFGHLNLAASLRNAFDTKYYEPTAFQVPQTLPMPGRSFYLEASVNF
ncbi:MAG: TonB-dependent receptor [Methylococcaceae bacterium]